MLFMFGFFSKKAEKEDVEKFKVGVQTAFEKIKQDLNSTSRWIKHLSGKTEQQDDEISDIYEELSSVRSELENVKNMIDILGNTKSFKQQQTVFNKQTAVGVVQTPVQTAVQGTFLDNFLDHLSITERAIVWVLLNSDLKLSYDDMAAMLGKERATIRGQVNSIRQKSEGLISEQIEKNNKKRFYVSEKLKGTMLKKAKVRLKRGKNREK